MRTVILIGIVVVAVALGIFAYQYAVDSPYRISAEVAKQMVNAHQVDVILDVRTDVERTALGFYPGSVHIQSADLDTRMPLLYPNKDILILAYCNTGHRARMATDKLHALGYKNSVYIATQYTSLL